MSTPIRILIETYPTQDGLVVFLQGEGYDGTINDMILKYLGSLGHAGALNDRIKDYTDNPGNGTWILETGSWDDSGSWLDTSNWNDS